MIERRSGHERRGLPRADDSQVEQALETVRFLRPEIVEFVRAHGPASAGYFDRVISIWYDGTLEQRVAFVKTSSGDPALSRAWSIIHAAGALAAPLIAHAVRRYYRQSKVDARA